LESERLKSDADDSATPNPVEPDDRFPTRFPIDSVNVWFVRRSWCCLIAALRHPDVTKAPAMVSRDSGEIDIAPVSQENARDAE